MLAIDNAVRGTKQSTTTSTPAKDPNSMDLDAMPQKRAPKEKEPLSAEQLKWFNERKCIKCGQEPAPGWGKRCQHPNPKYKGYYDIPKRDKGKQPI
jgi:hypothetical protein